MCIQYLQKKMEEEQKSTKQRKSKGQMRNNKGRNYEAESEHTQTEWVLCSEDWRDIVIMYVPQLNGIAIEDNYVNISLEQIEDAYIEHGKQRKPHKKKVK